MSVNSFTRASVIVSTSAEGHKGIAEFYFPASDLLYIIFDIFRVGGDDRAIVMVVGVLKLIAFIEESRIEDERYALLYQPGDMTMGKLCGIALGFAGDRFNAKLVDLTVGAGRKYHAET